MIEESLTFRFSQVTIQGKCKSLGYPLDLDECTVVRSGALWARLALSAGN